MSVRSNVSLLIVIIASLATNAPANGRDTQAPAKSGVGIHLGAMFASDDQVYFGRGNDIYAEVVVNRKSARWSISTTAGFAWREYTEYSLITGIVYDEQEILIFPLMVRVDFYLSRQHRSFNPFIGIGGGYYLAVQGPSSAPAFAVRVGGDIPVSDRWFMRAEIRTERTLDEPQLGGVMATIGGYVNF